MQRGVDLWPEVSVSDFLVFFGVDIEPFLRLIYYPSDWQGAARLAQWLVELPVSLALIVGVPLVIWLPAIITLAMFAFLAGLALVSVMLNRDGRDAETPENRV